MSETGLGAMRLLGQSGVVCWAVDAGDDPPGFSSRYCERRFRLSAGASVAEVVAVLDEIADGCPGRAALLPTSDRFVQLVSGLRARLGGTFDLAVPALDVVEDLLDKQRFAERAACAELLVPRTVPLHDLVRLGDAVRQVGLPAVVKPRTSDPRRGAFPKAVVVRSLDDVRALAARHGQSALPRLVVQEYVPGGDATNLSVAVALDAASTPVATFVARKRRQGNRGAGVGTFVERYDDEEAAAVARRFLRRIGYVGVAEMELKRHARSNELYAIEVNPRLWSQVALPAAAGLNFPLLSYRIATGASVAPQQPAAGPATWHDLVGDSYWTFCEGGYWRRGEVSALGWLRQALTSRGHPFFTWRDPVPAMKRLWHQMTPARRMPAGRRA